MLSVGIVAKTGKWAEALEAKLPGKGFAVSGWIAPEPVPNGELDDLIGRSALIWIPELLDDRMEAATRVIRKTKHLLLGFPVTAFVEEAFTLMKLSHEAQVMVQVGHHERHHPAIRSCMPLLNHPRAVYLHHHLTTLPDPSLSPFFLYEMVSDLSLVLPLIQVSLKKIKAHACLSANRAPVSVDVRIEFHNGALVSLLYRSLMEEPQHRIEIIQPESVLSIGLLEGESILRIPGSALGEKGSSRLIWSSLGPDSEVAETLDPHVEEQVSRCISFLNTLRKGQGPLSPLEDGFQALEIATQVQAQICRY